MSCRGLLHQQNVFSDIFVVFFFCVLFCIVLASGGDDASELLSSASPRASTKKPWKDTSASGKSQEGGNKTPSISPSSLQKPFCVIRQSTEPTTHVLHTLDLLIQDSLATDRPPLTRAKQQAGFLWVLALQVLGGEELRAVIHNISHPPNITSKTAMFIEKGNIVQSIK